MPFYAGLTLEEIGGTGVRWQERDAAAAYPESEPRREYAITHAAPDANGKLRLGSFRSIWAGPEVAASPALKFLVPEARAELSPADAQRLGLAHGDRVTIGSNGSAIEAVVALRNTAPEGSVFVETNALEGPLVEVRKA